MSTSQAKYYKEICKSPLGEITIICDEEGKHLVALQLKTQDFGIKAILCKKGSHLPALVKTKKWLDAYFAGDKPKISDLPLAPQGTSFQKAVWKILCKIPYGKTETYGNIAKKIAKASGKAKMAAQAVGGAVGYNPIAIVIPCHRVVGANGNLTGYGGGIDYKIKLLKHEGVDMRNFYAPIAYNGSNFKD